MEAGVTTRKRGRPRGGRAFDHDEARRLRARGLTLAAIGRLLGVDPTSVGNVCAKTITPREPPRLRLAGPQCMVSDKRWCQLQAWADRKHPGRQAPMLVQMRVQHLRATVR